MAKNVSKDVGKKAMNLFKSNRVRLDLETDKRMHFKVQGDSEEHSVIFDKEKNAWQCSCKFSTLKDSLCSHIEGSVLLMTYKK